MLPQCQGGKRARKCLWRKAGIVIFSGTSYQGYSVKEITENVRGDAGGCTKIGGAGLE